jgi:hypothetical protein
MLGFLRVEATGPSLARGEDGPDMWGPPVTERKGEAGREAGARGKVGRGRLAGRAE